jgi:hypothetical protein
MIQEDCLLGCEVSGHYFFSELRGGDDGLFASLYVCDLIRRSKPFEKLFPDNSPNVLGWVALGDTRWLCVNPGVRNRTLHHVASRRGYRCQLQAINHLLSSRPSRSG